MLLTLNEPELVQAIEVYINSLHKHPVTVSDLTISGTRSNAKEGLTVTVDLSGEAIRSEYAEGYEPKYQPEEDDYPISSDLKKEEPSEKETVDFYDGEVDRLKTLPKLNKEQQDVYTQVLQALNDNPKNKNRQLIIDAIEMADEITMQYIEGNQFYNDWLALEEENAKEKAIDLSSEIEEMDNLIEQPEPEPEVMDVQVDSEIPEAPKAKAEESTKKSSILAFNTPDVEPETVNINETPVLGTPIKKSKPRTKSIFSNNG